MPMDFNRYFTNADIEGLLQEWIEKYPQLATLSSIGRSYEGRPIWLLTLTNTATGAPETKPAIWIDANIHATEIAGTTTALCVADHLLSGYGADDRPTRLMDTCTFYILPRVNPDGAELAQGASPRYIRSGVRPYPYEDKDEGLHSEDIDGDGRILEMRMLDPTGDWKISSLDPRLMEKRAPDEVGGVYYRIFTEGRVEEYDGYLIKEARNLQGLDFNRNFPFEWRPENDQTGAGPYPASEPEIKALIDFVVAHPNINFALTLHTFSRALLRPYSTKADDEMDTNDLWVYKKIGMRGTELTGYRCVSTFHDFKYHPKEVTTGAFDDWLFDHFGVFTFTIELWDLPSEAGIKDRKFIDWWRDHPHAEDLQILKWADEHSGPGAYVDWYPFQHPQLGPVELGGWNRMYTWRNPPPACMGAEAARQIPFVLSLAEMLPHLSIKTLEVSALGDGDYHINLVVENSGFLATFTSNQGKNRKAVRPVRAELVLSESVRLINGKRRAEIGFLEGRSRDLDVTAFGASSPTTNRGRVEWVLHSAQQVSVTIKVLSDRAGSLECQLQLG
jgi:murein tripeptide amidase MpaA